MTFLAEEKVFCFLFFLQQNPVQGQDCVSVASSDLGQSLCDSLSFGPLALLRLVSQLLCRMALWFHPLFPPAWIQAGHFGQCIGFRGPP